MQIANKLQRKDQKKDQAKEKSKKREKEQKPKNKSKLLFILGGIVLVVAIAFIAIWQAQEMSPTNATSEKFLKRSKPFVTGLYYRLPNLQNPQAKLTQYDGQVGRDIILNPGGFDIWVDRVIYPNGNELVLVNSNGDKKVVPVPGLFSISRPSLSPDGKRVAVQASSSADNPPKDLNIYIVELGTGKFTQVSTAKENDVSPEWFDRANKVAYSSLSAKEGANLHIYNIDKKREEKVMKDVGSLHIALSADGKHIASFERHKIYNLETGKQEADLTDNLITHLRAAGYSPDIRFPGSLNTGTFMLDGTFSPDGKYLVMSGAMAKGDQYGEVIYQINNVGEEFKVLVDLIPTNPAFSSNNNFSQQNPTWLYK